ncbi:MAG: cell division ATPase MinD [Methanomicrobiales archaeon]
MGTVYTIASGKGGTGKTTLVANIGSLLAASGRKTCIIDAELGMANLGLILGLEEIPVTLHEVLAGKNDIHDAIYEGPHGVHIVPSGLSLQGFEQADTERLKDVIEELRGEYEFLIIDSPAGISRDVVIPLAAADEVILVVTPDIASIINAIKTRSLTEMVGGRVSGAIVNRFSSATDTINREHLEKVMELPIIAILPEDASVRRSSAERIPVSVKYPSSPVSKAFHRLSAEIAGIDYEEEPEVSQTRKGGVIDRLARRLFGGEE